MASNPQINRLSDYDRLYQNSQAQRSADYDSLNRGTDFYPLNRDYIVINRNQNVHRGSDYVKIDQRHFTEEKEDPERIEKPKPLPKLVKFGLIIGPVVALSIIGVQLVKDKTAKTVEDHAPAILAAVGALLTLQYVKRTYPKTMISLCLAAAAGFMVYNNNRRRVL